MLCAKCNRDNPTDAQFCQRCSARLEVTCSACATANGFDANFCKKCGAGLRVDNRPAAASSERLPTRSPKSETAVQLVAPPSDVIEGERKAVTELFADIKGSMELMEDLDPEEARQFGPYSSRPGYDPIAQATSGFMSLNGSVDGPATKPAQRSATNWVHCMGRSARWPRCAIVIAPAKASMSMWLCWKACPQTGPGT